jgi:hypothetical protein
MSLTIGSLRFVLFVRQSYPAVILAHLISFLLEKPTILLPQTIMVRAPGCAARTKNRIEALGSPDRRKMRHVVKAVARRVHAAADNVQCPLNRLGGSDQYCLTRT